MLRRQYAEMWGQPVVGRKAATEERTRSRRWNRNLPEESVLDSGRTEGAL